MVFTFRYCSFPPTAYRYITLTPPGWRGRKIGMESANNFSKIRKKKHIFYYYFYTKPTATKATFLFEIKVGDFLSGCPLHFHPQTTHGDITDFSILTALLPGISKHFLVSRKRERKSLPHIYACTFWRKIKKVLAEVHSDDDGKAN